MNKNNRTCRLMLVFFTILTALQSIVNVQQANAQEVVHPKIGTTVQSKDGALKLKLIAKKQNYKNGEAETR